MSVFVAGCHLLICSIIGAEAANTGNPGAEVKKPVAASAPAKSSSATPSPKTMTPSTPSASARAKATTKPAPVAVGAAKVVESKPAGATSSTISKSHPPVDNSMAGVVKTTSTSASSPSPTPTSGSTTVSSTTSKTTKKAAAPAKRRSVDSRIMVPPPPPEITNFQSIQEPGHSLSTAGVVLDLLSKADLERMKSRVETTLTKVKVDKEEHDRSSKEKTDRVGQFEQLYKEGVVSRRELETARRELRDVEMSTKEISERLADAQTDISRIDSALEHLKKSAKPEHIEKLKPMSKLKRLSK